MNNKKFRAWGRYGEWENDGESRKWEMIDSHCLCFEGFEPICDLLTDKEDEFFMQFTGLRDKNGVEIYEGDITNQGYFIKWCDKCCGFQPFLNSKSLDICHSCDHDFNWFDVLDDEKLEVIGNIYANPELIED